MSLTIRGALLWSFAERYTSLIVTIVSTMILARLLTPAQVGVFSLCAAVAAVAGVLRDFGISEYLIQEKDLDRQKLRAAFGVAIMVGWSIGACVYLGHSVAADFFDEPGVGQVLAVLSLNFLILPFASPAFALLNREMAFRKIFAVQTISNTAQSLSAVGLAYAGFGYMSLAWAPVISITLQTLLVTAMRPRDSLMLPSLAHAGPVLRYGSMFVSSRVIETVTRNAHEFVIAKQFGFASVGLFSRAFGLLELFYNNVAAAILRVATPAFANEHRSGQDLAGSFARGTAIFTAVAWPFFGLVALTSDELIGLLFGAQWAAAAPICSILAVAMMPSYLCSLAPNLLSATGNIKRRLQTSLIYSPVHLVALAAASVWSLKAVAAVWGLSNLLMLILYSRHVSQVLGTSIRTLFGPSLASAGIAAACIATQAATAMVARAAALPAMVVLLLTILSGAVSWLLAVYLSQHPLLTEIQKVTRRLRQKAA